MIALINEVKKLLKKFALFLIIEIITLIIIFIFWMLDKIGFVQTFFSIFIMELCFKNLWSYKMNLKEKFFIHSLKSEGEEFNKEYFDLYYSTNLIRIKFLVVFEYLAFIIGLKLDEFFSQEAQKFFSPIFLCTFSLFVGFIIWIIWLFWFLNCKENKKLDRLILIKKENFGSYTTREKEILYNKQ